MSGNLSFHAKVGIWLYFRSTSLIWCLHVATVWLYFWIGQQRLQQVVISQERSTESYWIEVSLRSSCKKCSDIMQTCIRLQKKNMKCGGHENEDRGTYSINDWLYRYPWCASYKDITCWRSGKSRSVIFSVFKTPLNLSYIRKSERQLKVESSFWIIATQEEIHDRNLFIIICLTSF